MELNRIHQTFLSILRFALWGQEVEPTLVSNLTEQDWREILTLSRQQAIDGVMADAILRLNENYRPSRAICLELISLSIQIEELIERQQKAVAHIQKIYDELEAPFVLLKGLGVAESYPNPRLRMPGDLDLYLYQEGDYERVNNWAKEQGYKMGEKTLYEQVVHIGPIVVENHLHLTYFGLEKYDRLLAEHSKQMQQAEVWQWLDLEHTRVRILPPTFNAIYIFHHILHHFSYLGIGLRQISDWFLFLNKYQDEIDRAEFIRLAKAYDLLKPMQYFAQMGVAYLGVSPESLPFEVKPAGRYAKMIIQDTLKAGNFGLEYFSGKEFSNIWYRRLFMFRKTLIRGLRVAPIAPEHICPIPLIAISTRLRLLCPSLFSTKKGL